MKNPTENSRQCCLINKATNKTTKMARIATIVGRRVIGGTGDPFYDEETKKGGNNDQKNWTFNGYCNHCGKKGNKEKD